MSEFDTKVIPIRTDGSGDASVTVRLYGLIHAVGIRVGTLSTPDVAITDGLTGAPVLSDTAIAADARYLPRVPVQDENGDAIADAFAPPAITGTVLIEVTGGGNAKNGAVVLLFEH